MTAPTTVRTVPVVTGETSSTRDADPVQAGPVPAGKTPAGPGAITWIGVLLAVLVGAAGVVAVQDALARAGTVSVRPWLEWFTSRAGTLTPQPWLVPLGAGLIGCGLLLLVLAIRPRPRNGIRLRAGTGVFLRPGDLARIACDAAEGVDGVTSATAKVRGRRGRTLRVDALATGHGLDRTVTDAVRTRLEPLARPTRVTTRIRVSGGPR